MDRDDGALRQYVENMALLFADMGFPRMSARVLMQLMASDDGAMTAAEISETLAISPAAVSGAVRYLQHIGMIDREPVPGSRRDRYRLPDDTWYLGSVVKSGFFTGIVKMSEDGAAAAGGSQTPAGARIAAMGDFYTFIQSELDGMLERYLAHRRELATQEGQTP